MAPRHFNPLLAAPFRPSQSLRLLAIVGIW